MRLILDEEETWSLMTLITAQVLDQVELSDEATKANPRLACRRRGGQLGYAGRGRRRERSAR